MKSALFSLLIFVPTAATAFEKFGCFGTEPFWDATITDKQISFKLENSTKTYLGPKYSAPVGTSLEYVLSFEARNESSTVTGFIVHENGMLVLDEQGKRPPNPLTYNAYCSDGMSERGYPYSIHIIVNGKAYTGCCSTASKPAVGQDQ
jgi:uncharacterized membrane protein